MTFLYYALLCEVRNSWPPPKKEAMIEEKTLMNTLPAGIVEVDWRWSRTQYRDDLWIEPKIRSYRLYLDQYKNLDGQISCKKNDGQLPGYKYIVEHFGHRKPV